MRLTAAKLAELVNGTVIGNPEAEIRGVAPAESAQEGDLTFAENQEYFQKAITSNASVILVGDNYGPCDKTIIRVANPRVALAQILDQLFPEANPAPGIHPTAVVDPTAQIDPTAYIGPYCVIERGVEIGPGTILMAHVWVGEKSRIGAQTRIFPNVSIYQNSKIGNRVRIHSGSVIGSDGFGYIQDGGIHRKIPQVGWVEIGDDVEIGANVTIDRGALGPTLIGQGTKIDNLVQIAHNVQIGKHCIIIAQVGIAGSTKIGNYTILAGQVGIAGHLKIGDRVIVAAQSGVTKDIPDGQHVLGSPAIPDKQAKRQLMALRHLPDLLKRVAQIEEVLRLKTHPPNLKRDQQSQD